MSCLSRSCSPQSVALDIATKPDTLSTHLEIMMPDVNEVLAERGTKYGHFADGADLAMRILRELEVHPGWYYLTQSTRYAIVMVVFKIARIVNGRRAGENHEDNWTDIAGYAELARLEAEKRNSVGAAK